MRDEIMAVKKELDKLKEESVVMELLNEKTNKRLFFIWIITFLNLVCIACYVFYIKNDNKNVIDNITTNDAIITTEL